MIDLHIDKGDVKANVKGNLIDIHTEIIFVLATLRDDKNMRLTKSILHDMVDMTDDVLRLEKE